MAISVDRNRRRLAGADPLQLRLLVIGVDEDVVERNDVAEPLSHADEVADIDHAVGEGAVDRRAHRGEIEVALGLGQRCLQLRQLGAGLRLLRLGDLDTVARGIIGRLRRLQRRHALIARGFGGLIGRMRSKSLGAQRLLAIVIEPGPFQAGFRRNNLRLRLLDRAFLRGDLAADTLDGGPLGGDLGARGIDRDTIVAVVDPINHLAGVHQRVVAGQDRRDVTGYSRAQRGVVGAHIGVVGRDIKPSDQKIMHAIACERERDQRTDAHQHQLLAIGGVRRGGIGGSSDGLVDHGRNRRLRGAALGFFGDLTAKLLCRRRRIFTPRRGFYLFRLRAKHPRGLVSRCGHHGLLTTTRHARESHGRSHGFPVLHGFAPTTISIDRTVRSRYHDNSPNLPDGALQYIPKIEFLQRS